MKKEKFRITFVSHSKLDFSEDDEGPDFIGRGSYGSVFKGKLDGVVVAIKRMHSLPHIEGHDADMRWEILGEIEKYFKIGKHQNIAECLGVAEKNDIFYLVMEYFQSDLHTIIKTQMLHPDSKETVRFSLKDKLCISLGISRALQFCHSKGLIHRDVRPSNVLLERVFREDGGMVYNARVCDFGLACARNAYTDPMGAPFFVPPEFFELGDEYKIEIGEETDVYSLGITIWCIFAERLPSHQVLDLSLECKDKTVQTIAELVKWCCKTAPQERCRVADVVKRLRECLDVIEYNNVLLPIRGHKTLLRSCWGCDEVVSDDELRRIIRAERAMGRNVKSLKDFVTCHKLPDIDDRLLVTDEYGELYTVLASESTKLVESVKRINSFDFPIHRNLIRIHHILSDDGNVHYVVPKSFLVHYSLYEMMTTDEPWDAERPIFEDDEFFLFLRDVVSGLSALRAKNIIHCDLDEFSIFAIRSKGKSRYFVWADEYCRRFSRKQKFELHISDNLFEKGIDIRKYPSGWTERIHTEGVIPPEIREGTACILKFGKYDVYSLGVVCFGLFSTRVLNESRGVLTEDECWNPKIRNLITRMLKSDYGKRISFKELKAIIMKEVDPLKEKRKRLIFLYERHRIDSVSALFYLLLEGKEEKDDSEVVKAKEMVGENFRYDEKDIAVVCEQANATRQRAIEALNECDGDVIDAVLLLDDVDDAIESEGSDSEDDDVVTENIRDRPIGVEDCQPYYFFANRAKSLYLHNPISEPPSFFRRDEVHRQTDMFSEEESKDDDLVTTNRLGANGNHLRMYDRMLELLSTYTEMKTETQTETCTGVIFPEQEINIVRKTANVSRDTAKKALRNANGDIVAAVFQLLNLQSTSTNRK